MKKSLIGILGLLLLSSCGRLDLIPYSPAQTPEGFLAAQPTIDVVLGPIDIVLIQPTSTVFVYALGIVAIGAGARFWRRRGHQRSRLWWAIALVLWGAGALVAGTSYQALGYELKCAGRTLCTWTSWWEVVYLILSVASIDAMMLAVAYACTAGRWRKALTIYAILNAALYTGTVLIGALIPVKFLVSFELLIVVAVPSILAFLIINGWRYAGRKDAMDLVLLGTWIGLALVLGLYFLYAVTGLTQTLWARGLWFSDNDVLHIGLIIWMIYIDRVVARRITDLQGA
ncbi:MAG: hypothetical protein MUQ30_19560 [Anaerolineae bacterium]|nr:hypothetical protein [Anaerolineae bacterium]